MAYKVDDEFSKRLGRMIREQRVKCRISQANLAEQLKLNISYISMVETGKRRFSQELFGKVLQILEADIKIIDKRKVRF